MSIQNHKSINVVANLVAIVGAGTLLSLSSVAFSAPSEHIIAQSSGSINPADTTNNPTPANGPRNQGDATQNTPPDANTLPGPGVQNDINQTSPSLGNQDPNRTRVSPNTSPNSNPANVNTNDGTYLNNPSGTPSNSNMNNNNMDMNQGGSYQQRTNTGTYQQRTNTTNQQPSNGGTYNNNGTYNNRSNSTNGTNGGSYNNSTQQNSGGVRALW